MPAMNLVRNRNGAQDNRSIRAGIRLRTEAWEASEIATVFLPDLR
jgi:hypothetical protein